VVQFFQTINNLLAGGRDLLTPARLYLFPDNQTWRDTMVLEKYYRKAAAEYFCNVDEFIRIGEGHKLTD
jgi:hypothetical protein